MKWVTRTSLDKKTYTALETEDAEGQELGRYYHEGGGFRPMTRNNQALARVDEAEAREFVIRQVLDRYKREMAELGRLLNAAMGNVPHGTTISQTTGT
jgi:hypothetical protein